MASSLTGVSNPIIQWSWVEQNAGAIRSALWQHVELSLIAVGMGFAISLPVALVVAHFRRARGPVIALSSLLYTIPSIALFAIVQPVVGYFSVTSAEIALVSYTLLILIRNIVAGLDAVPPDVREAAHAMGFSTVARYLRVDLPLALPAIFAGLRVATVTVVGLVNVTAFIGLGGLGQLLIEGFQEDGFRTPIVVALVLSILLAAVGDLIFVIAERVFVRWTRTSRAA